MSGNNCVSVGFNPLKIGAADEICRNSGSKEERLMAVHCNADLKSG